MLKLDNVQLTGDYGYLSTNLRWLYWNGFPLESMPINFNLEKVAAIDIKWSNLTRVWEKSQVVTIHYWNSISLIIFEYLNIFVHFYLYLFILNHAIYTVDGGVEKS